MARTRHPLPVTRFSRLQRNTDSSIRDGAFRYVAQVREHPGPPSAITMHHRDDEGADYPTHGRHE
jgi:hypothetical protein